MESCLEMSVWTPSNTDFTQTFEICKLLNIPTGVFAVLLALAGVCDTSKSLLAITSRPRLVLLSIGDRVLATNFKTLWCFLTSSWPRFVILNQNMDLNCTMLLFNVVNDFKQLIICSDTFVSWTGGTSDCRKKKNKGIIAALPSFSSKKRSHAYFMRTSFILFALQTAQYGRLPSSQSCLTLRQTRLTQTCR